MQSKSYKLIQNQVKEIVMNWCVAIEIYANELCKLGYFERMFESFLNGNLQNSYQNLKQQQKTSRLKRVWNEHRMKSERRSAFIYEQVSSRFFIVPLLSLEKWRSETENGAGAGDTREEAHDEKIKSGWELIDRSTEKIVSWRDTIWQVWLKHTIQMTRMNENLDVQLQGHSGFPVTFWLGFAVLAEGGEIGGALKGVWVGGVLRCGYRGRCPLRAQGKWLWLPWRVPLQHSLQESTGEAFGTRQRAQQPPPNLPSLGVALLALKPIYSIGPSMLENQTQRENCKHKTTQPLFHLLHYKLRWWLPKKLIRMNMNRLNWARMSSKQKRKRPGPRWNRMEAESQSQAPPNSK